MGDANNLRSLCWKKTHVITSSNISPPSGLNDKSHGLVNLMMLHSQYLLLCMPSAYVTLAQCDVYKGMNVVLHNERH